MPVYTYKCPDCGYIWERTRNELGRDDRCTRCAAFGRLQGEPEDEPQQDERRQRDKP